MIQHCDYYFPSGWTDKDAKRWLWEHLVPYIRTSLHRGWNGRQFWFQLCWLRHESSNL